MLALLTAQTVGSFTKVIHHLRSSGWYLEHKQQNTNKCNQKQQDKHQEMQQKQQLTKVIHHLHSSGWYLEHKQQNTNKCNKNNKKKNNKCNTNNS